MKISKINHTKSAIAKSQGIVKGVLYKDPKANNNDFINIEKHIETVNKSAKRLFNVFNSIQKTNDNNKKYKDFITGELGNKKINELFIDRNNYKMNDFSFVLKKMNVCVALNNYQLSVCQDCINLYLRKDLTSQKDNLITFYKCLNDNNAINNNKDSIKELYDGIKESYTKEKRIKRIKKSIENRNILVQPEQGIIKLAKPVVNGDGESRNQREKKALSDFIDMYADINEDNRKEYLKKLIRLISLFLDDSENLDEENFLFNDFNILDVLAKWKSEQIYLIDENKYKESKSKNEKDINRNKLLNIELKIEIRNKIAYLYRRAMNALENNKLCLFEDRNINEFWIHYIEQAIEKILTKANIDNLYKLQYSYIKEKVRKDITNYISTKYIGIGKAVYQFGMNDIATNSDKKELGRLNKNVLDGITSFDYEIIKAEETLQRETATAVAFAANNLSRATVNVKEAKDKTDFLLWKIEDVEKYLLNKENTIKNVLQFFGGYSSRTDLRETIDDFYKDSSNKEVNLVNDLKEYIYTMRNETMHFSTLNEQDEKLKHQLIAKMFENDAIYCSRKEKEKYCNVGLNLFYSDDKIKELLIKLYEKQSARTSQVPSFNTILSRKHFAEFLKIEFDLDPDFKDTSKEGNREKWLGALYYTFKEIYYNGFLQEETKIKKYFAEALYSEYKALNDEYFKEKKQNNRARKSSDLSATENFKRRYDEIKNRSLVEICQLIMTEYNIQNTSRKKKSKNDEKNNPEIFKFYKVILNNLIKLSFKEYILNEDSCKFLIEDSKDRQFVENIKQTNIEPKEFLPDLSLTLYDSLIKKFTIKPYLHKWYIASRFLDGKTLNELVGSLRSYVQYVGDIIRRANECGNKVSYQYSLREKIEQIINVLDMCTNISSIYSNNVSDYFDNYNEFLANYIEEDCINDEIYSDEANYIANRNIIEAKLFGPTTVLKKALKDKKINKQILEDYKDIKQEINSLMASEDLDKEKQEKIIAYQNIKNQVELRNLVDYGKLINDLLGQLINWSFLRERDLLYFQLGFHYTCLNNSTEKPKDGYQEVQVGDCHIVNPILWQIAAMYIYGIGMLTIKKGVWSFTDNRLSAGSKINQFCSKYSLELGYKEDYLYNAGLEVFEVIKEHETMINLRNSIDHFHYYYDSEFSILDYYSVVFDRFFTYDIKYKKNVVNLLSNILLRYKVVTKGINFETLETKDTEKTKKRAQINITNLYSEESTYKISDKKYDLEIKSKEYLDDINKILNYSTKTKEENS